MINRLLFVALLFYSSFSLAQNRLSKEQIQKTPYRITSKTDGLANASTQADVTIDFEKKAFMVTEATTGTDGCRRYKDYTLRMVISGGTSTTDATVILATSGTATEGVDYLITTNGNFVSPSKALSIPKGSSTPPSFTLRVFDDTNPEATETIIINYSLNNNSGNLLNGQTALTLTVKIQDNDLVPYLPGTGAAAIGQTGDLSYLDHGDPLDPRVAKRKIQLVYTGVELRGAGALPGPLTSLAFFVMDKKSTRAFKNLTIKLVNSPADHLLDADNFYSFENPITVFTASEFSTEANWNTFPFPTPSPFIWTGGNLGVEICYDNGTTAETQEPDKFASYTDHPNPGKELEPKEWNMAIFENLSCGTAPSNILTASVFNDRYRPQIQLGYNSSGISVQTATATTSRYVSLGTSNSFYSSDNVLGSISSPSANLGCVSFSVEEAESNWVSTFNAMPRSGKVFQVTPTEGAAGTTYTISFYLTTAELGGKVASSLKLAKTSAASAAAATTSNTTVISPTVTAFGANAYQFTGTFTGFSRFFLVQENALPVTLTSLRAVPQEQNSVSVQWTTSSETNFEHFELEHSLHPTERFTKIASLPAGKPEYHYLHQQPSLGTANYYRLKMVDQDGSYAYSKLTSALLRAAGELTLAPNPAKEKVLLASPSGIASIRVLTMDGRMFMEKLSNGDNSLEVTLPKVPSGLYLIQITTRSGAIERRKLLIE
jgi:hypothetical protein